MLSQTAERTTPVGLTPKIFLTRKKDKQLIIATCLYKFYQNLHIQI